MRFRSLALVFAFLVLGAHAARADTLFADLGEKPGIERLVARTFAIWKADPLVGPTFEDTNSERFKRLLVEQICMLSGGGCKYSGRSMAEAHKGLHLATVQFNAVAEGLQTAMRQLDYPYAVQNRLLSLLAPMYRDVVTR